VPDDNALRERAERATALCVLLLGPHERRHLPCQECGFIMEALATERKLFAEEVLAKFSADAALVGAKLAAMNLRALLSDKECE